MRRISLLTLTVLCVWLLGGQGAHAQLDEDIRDALRHDGDSLIVREADTVTCTDFEIIVNRDCERQGLQFIILSQGKYAPYHPSKRGDTIYFTLLRRGVPRLPTTLPHVPIDRGKTERIIPLCVIFGDTAWHEIIYSPDSVSVSAIDTAPNVLVRRAELLPANVLPPVFIAKNKGTADIQRYLKKKHGELEKLGNIICLPAGYYQCFAEPLTVLRIGRRETVNELAGQKIFFFQLTDTSASGRSMALQLLGGSE